MTQTMLERAARAAFESHAWGDVGPEEAPHTWDDLPEEWRVVYRKLARAVLMAVREPGQSIMDDAFSDVLEPVYPGDFGRVIGAILNEPQP